MSIIFSDNFTGADNTVINGYNSWVCKNSSDVASTTTQIQSNQAQCTASGSIYAYHSVTGWDGSTCNVTFSRWYNTGLRFQNYLVLGSTGTTYSTFQANGISVYMGRADSGAINNALYVYDGATTVTNKNISFLYDGSPVVVTFTKASDGSGSATVTQGVNSDSLTWGARTWVKGGGNYFGVNPDHNGSDGTGGQTYQQWDNFEIRGVLPASIKTIDGVLIADIKSIDGVL